MEAGKTAWRSGVRCQAPWSPLAHGAAAGQESCSRVSVLLPSGGGGEGVCVQVCERDPNRDERNRDRDRSKLKHKRLPQQSSPRSQRRGAQVQSLVRKLDPTCLN